MKNNYNDFLNDYENDTELEDLEEYNNFYIKQDTVIEDDDELLFDNSISVTHEDAEIDDDDNDEYANIIEDDEYDSKEEYYLQQLETIQSNLNNNDDNNKLDIDDDILWEKTLQQIDKTYNKLLEHPNQTLDYTTPPRHTSFEPSTIAWQQNRNATNVIDENKQETLTLQHIYNTLFPKRKPTPVEFQKQAYKRYLKQQGEQVDDNNVYDDFTPIQNTNYFILSQLEKLYDKPIVRNGAHFITPDGIPLPIKKFVSYNNSLTSLKKQLDTSTWVKEILARKQAFYNTKKHYGRIVLPYGFLLDKNGNIVLDENIKFTKEEKQYAQTLNENKTLFTDNISNLNSTSQRLLDSYSEINIDDDGMLQAHPRNNSYSHLPKHLQPKLSIPVPNIIPKHYNTIKHNNQIRLFTQMYNNYNNGTPIPLYDNNGMPTGISTAPNQPNSYSQTKNPYHKTQTHPVTLDQENTNIPVNPFTDSPSNNIDGTTIDYDKLALRIDHTLKTAANNYSEQEIQNFYRNTSTLYTQNTKTPAAIYARIKNLTQNTNLTLEKATTISNQLNENNTTLDQTVLLQTYIENTPNPPGTLNIKNQTQTIQRTLSYLYLTKYSPTHHIQTVTRLSTTNTQKLLNHLILLKLVASFNIIGIGTCYYLTPQSFQILKQQPYKVNKNDISPMLATHQHVMSYLIANLYAGTPLDVLCLGEENYPKKRRNENGRKVYGENLVVDWQIAKDLSTYYQKNGRSIKALQTRHATTVWGQGTNTPEYNNTMLDLFALVPPVTSTLTNKWHIPDIVLKRPRHKDTTPAHIAVEVEIGNKTEKALAKTLNAYKNQPQKYAQIIWVVNDHRNAHRLEKQARQIGLWQTGKMSIIPIVTKEQVTVGNPIWTI